MFKSTRFRLALTVGLMFSAAMIWAAMSLQGRVRVVYDQYRVPTIQASTELEAIYMQGYLHAKDRFFQMDVQRRLFAGTLSELVGPAGIPQDVQLRTLGLDRAALRSLDVQTPEVLAWLEAYSDGVNAWLDNKAYGTTDDELCDDELFDDETYDDGSSGSSGSSISGARILVNSLPPEYGALEIDRDGIPDWTPLDSLIVAKGLAFGLSFDLGDIDRTIALQTFLGVGPFLGFNGLQLFGADLYMTTPFNSTVSIPATSATGNALMPEDADFIDDPNLMNLLQDYRAAAVESPVLQNAIEKNFTKEGSNWFVADGSKTVSGFPLIANDPHLSLGTPATFYEVHLQVKGGLNVTGASFPGVPGVVTGCNDTICWGATVNPLDVTDVYLEVLAPLGPDPTQPTHTLFEGVPEPLQFIPQQFFFNAIGDTVNNTLVNANVPASSGGVTLIVPRRNQGPIVQVLVDFASPTPLTALTVQYTGWSATREIEAFRRFARATSTADFEEGLTYFDVGSQNFSYADINGNIAYYTSAELPIREDLQTLFFPDGLQPPYLIRDGTHARKHEWLAVQNPQPNQAIPYEILPAVEMPHVVNPASGIILNANNDPIGTSLDNVPWNEFRAGFNGRLYLSYNYAPGFRMGRIRQMFDDILGGAGQVSVDDFKTVQSNNQLLDAEFFVPYLTAAYANASASGAANLQALAADAAIAEAVSRLGDWDFSTPTGIAEGFDPGDNPPGLAPSQAEIDASVAATLYSVWRGQLVQRVIDTTLASLPSPVPLAPLAPGSAQSIIAVQRLLQAYPIRGGTGLSLINFFNEPDGPTAGERRDLILLRAMRSALDLLASNDFAPAFGNSTMLEDYRWGKLHRIVLAHPLGGPFDIPPPGSPFNLAPDLPGFSRAGGLGAVDASAHAARADGLNEFMFSSGPSFRMVTTLTPDGPVMEQVIPGGESGIPGSPNQIDQLMLWLVNAHKPMPLVEPDVLANAQSCQILGPPPEADSGLMPDFPGTENSQIGISFGDQEISQDVDRPRSQERGARRGTVRRQGR